MNRWYPQRQVPSHACGECKANPEKQVLEGHEDCLPFIHGRETADRVPVVVGLRVWDYDLKRGTVTELDYSFDGTPDGPLGIVAWHKVARDEGGTAMMDGSRIVTIHPFTGEKA